jgi:ABC-type transporter Mla maintaining outer membrane lipid asymmetry ATPase subunit MlaF
MTTFNIAPNAGRDPVATAMLHDLVDHLASEACEPVLRANQ